MAVKQTAGRTQLGEFAPKFAELNDDVLFGEVWSREDKLSLRDRSLVTVVALMAQGLTDESFRYHLMSAKANGNFISDLTLPNCILYSTNIEKEEEKIKRLISFLFESPLYSKTLSMET